MIRTFRSTTYYVRLAFLVLLLWLAIGVGMLYIRAAQLLTYVPNEQKMEGAVYASQNSGLHAAALYSVDQPYSVHSAVKTSFRQRYTGRITPPPLSQCVPCTHGIPQPPVIQARSAVVLDAASGALLFEKNPDISIPPASLTKLVTMYTVMQAIENGEIGLTDTISPPSQSWARNLPRGSSLMFLGDGQQVSVEELLQGLAVVSGNDAAIALAIHTAGSVAAFVKRMNAVVKGLGLQHTHFEDPNGLSEYNHTTARDFARFSAVYVREYPEHLQCFHSLRQFSYPQQHNMLKPQITIRQTATNTLLWKLSGCDGLKTGFIYESGFNIALTAQRNGCRFIAVILGGVGATMEEGKRIREANGITLMEWAFTHFSTQYAHNFSLHIPIVPVIGGQEPANKTAVRPLLTDPRGQHGAFTAPFLNSYISQDSAEHIPIEARVSVYEVLSAPIKMGEKIGTVAFFIKSKEGERVLAVFPLVADKTVNTGSTLRWKYDNLALKLYRTFIHR